MLTTASDEGRAAPSYFFPSVAAEAERRHARWQLRSYSEYAGPFLRAATAGAVGPCDARARLARSSRCRPVGSTSLGPTENGER